MPTIIFKLPDGRERAVEVVEGASVLQAAWDNNIDIEGACEGAMACSTCHVYLEERAFDQLPEPTEEEDDLLDLAWGVRPTSRLGCQITITADLDGIVLTLPATTNNQM
ncbi:MAG: 2Fe-2S iron-sulfur cluster-binding protein [Pseudomonadota bacterium]|mgnify:FL=1|jgi:ferredoxin|nr:2Fe-2S iron-sulfur cluster-binding protein [Pseudomonadota bacterium]|tara:strand:- start:173 stop:499 length:327 start_codon:yes stop_codon:yes gene_type:complete